MIKELPESAGAVLGVEVSGKISLEEEKAWIERLEARIAEHAKVSVLVILDPGVRWGVEAGIEDLKWLLTHMKQLHRIALVSESTVWKWLVAADSPFAKLVGIDEKHFEPARLAEAWQWVKEE